MSSTPPESHRPRAHHRRASGRRSAPRIGGLVPEGRAGRIAVLVLAVAALATAIGVAVLWPSYEEPTVDPTYAWSAGTSVVTESAEVVSTDVGPCGSPDNGRVLPGPPL